jgi:O-antigen/teichoic acid export membrane protein
MGTLGSQAISLGVMLLIVRLYTPAEVGMYNVWLSFATILTVVVTGRYELALFSTSRTAESYSIVKLALLLTVFLSVICTLGVGVAATYIGGVPSVVGEYWLVLAFAIFAMGVNKVILAVLSFKQAFKKMGLAKIWMSASIALAQVLAGYFALGIEGLIYGQAAGALIATAIACLWFDKAWFMACWTTPYNQMVATAKRYINFPIFSLPAGVVNTISAQLPIIIVASRFGHEEAGWLALTLKMMGAPVTLLASSVLDVFKEQAARDFRMTGNCIPVFMRTFKSLALLSLLPFVFVWFFSEWAFSFFMGPDWVQSGYYAVLLLPMFYLKFVVSPLSYTIFISQRQHADLVWQFVLMLVTIGCFILPEKIDTALWSYSLAYGAMYFVYFGISYRCAQGATR